MDLKALQDISYGLFIVTSKSGDRLNGQIANTILQVTAEPARISVTVHKDNLTHQFIEDSGVFAASMLQDSVSMDLIRLFGFNSGRNKNKLADVEFKEGMTGAPLVIDGSLSVIECRVFDKLDVGSHTIFAGDLVNAEVFREGNPLTYAIYHEVKKGGSPKNAPTYKLYDISANGTASLKTGASHYKCSVCGYVYNPHAGIPEQNINAGTAFANLPHEWICPVCGAKKSLFASL